MYDHVAPVHKRGTFTRCRPRGCPSTRVNIISKCYSADRARIGFKLKIPNAQCLQAVALIRSQHSTYKT